MEGKVARLLLEDALEQDEQIGVQGMFQALAHERHLLVLAGHVLCTACCAAQLRFFEEVGTNGHG